eukprot:CAMPEP_0170606652 /NCGR_PEP_ID=MMETSP0224-20130122/20628_1 /TAXON_ID=285029 /ORGANISM="Togula jolla, Strain CCCM 725" /LENGTH=251 /DNA_ID=CAMNT_0010931751 /DNA_START=33 /DNA_END=788 /DNA_ORIENTATION=+
MPSMMCRPCSAFNQVDDVVIADTEKADRSGRSEIVLSEAVLQVEDRIPSKQDQPRETAAVEVQAQAEQLPGPGERLYREEAEQPQGEIGRPQHAELLQGEEEHRHRETAEHQGKKEEQGQWQKDVEKLVAAEKTAEHLRRQTEQICERQALEQYEKMRKAKEEERRAALVEAFLRENDFYGDLNTPKTVFFMRRIYPIHAAVAKGDAALVELLLQRKADCSLKASGLTPLSLAERSNRNGSHEPVLALLRR